VARRLGVPTDAVHAWDLQAADAYRPAPVTFPDAVPLILAAERPMGAEYAEQYARLFDPQAHRVEWCGEPACDHTGFSVGFAGVESALFYGSYRGDTDSIRAVAHEAGHAVHRQFMNEHQKLAVYNTGPHFVFESFAIFNELLLLDHLYKTAPTPEAKAYYLRQFLDDVTFQIYGSAQETDLEQSIYADVRADAVHGAADLDALTLKVFARYRAGAALDPAMRVYWARNRLYFTDPLYDVNYLFAGLLAVQYLQQYEADPKGFSTRYVALLKNGFTDTPQALEKRFLGVDLDDPDRLVQAAAAVIDRRTTALEALYRR
jgi:oligoendopeptidase F